MATRKERTTDVLNDLVAHGVSEATFDKEIEWHQASSHGARHASSSCYKYRPDYQKGSRTKASLLKVTRACEDCFYTAIPASLQDDIKEGRDLIAKVRRLQSSRADKARDAATGVARCDEMLAELAKHRDSDLLQPVIESLRSKVRVIREQQTLVAAEVTDELLRFCAVAITPRDVTGAHCLSENDSEILGAYENKPVGALLYNEWTRDWINGGTFETARTQTVRVARALKWNEPAQLKTFTATPTAGESLVGMANRVWEARRDEIVDTLCTDWEATMTRHLEQGPDSIVAIWGVNGLDNDAEAMLATFKFDSRPNVAVLAVPRVVGSWFAKHGALGYGTIIEVLDASAISLAMGSSLEALSEEWNTVIAGARNGLALWDRAHGSAYRSFASAFTAGVRL